jgi:hypothetical protein
MRTIVKYLLYFVVLALLLSCSSELERPSLKSTYEVWSSVVNCGYINSKKAIDCAEQSVYDHAARSDLYLMELVDDIWTSYM